MKTSPVTSLFEFGQGRKQYGKQSEEDRIWQRTKAQVSAHLELVDKISRMQVEQRKMNEKPRMVSG